MNLLKHRPAENRGPDSRSLIRNILLTGGLVGFGCETERKAPNRVDIPEVRIPPVKEAQEKAQAQEKTPPRRSKKRRRKQDPLSGLPEPPEMTEPAKPVHRKKKRNSRYENLPSPNSINQ